MAGIFGGDTTFSKIFVGDSEVSKVFVGDTEVWPLTTYSLTLTLSESITGSSWSQSSITIGEEASQTVYINADTGYTFSSDTTIGLTETAGGSFYSTSVGSYDSTNDRFPVTITVADLTADQTGTLTHSSGTATVDQITVTLDRVDNISGSNHTTVVDTSLTGAFGTSYAFADQTISPAAGYYFTSGPTWTGDSLTGTYPSANTTITRTVTGATALETISLGNINSTFDWEGESLGFSISQTGPSTPVVTSKPSWITIGTLTPTTTQGVATASENPLGTTRSGTIVISKGTGSASDSINVTQQAQPDTIDITSASVSPQATTTQLLLQVNSSGPSTIFCSDNVSWITSCSVSGTVLTINMEENTGAARTGVVTVTKGSVSDTVTINQQAAVVCEFTSTIVGGTPTGGVFVAGGNGSFSSPRRLEYSAGTSGQSLTLTASVTSGCTIDFSSTSWFGQDNGLAVSQSGATISWDNVSQVGDVFFIVARASTTGDTLGPTYYRIEFT